MLRAITGLTAAYVIVLAIVMFQLSDAGSRASGIGFGEAMFASPMIVAYVVSLFVKSAEDRRVMFVFEVIFSVFSAVIFWSTFARESDAQYQLALFIIPLIGLPSVAIAGMIAMFGHRERQRRDKRGS